MRYLALVIAALVVAPASGVAQGLRGKVYDLFRFGANCNTPICLDLDPISGGDFDQLIKTLQGTLGLTVFMVTHDLESLYTVCDRVAALADGRVVAIGPMSTMLECTHPWVQTYFQGKRGALLAERRVSNH